MKRRFFLELLSSSCWTSILCSISTAAMNPRTSTGIQQIVFYVSTDGDDSWSDLSPNFGTILNPFATLTRARDAIRVLKQKQGGQLLQPVTVFVRGGTYFVNETIKFDISDSGTNQTPISYKAYQNEKPVFSGGRVIRGWKQTKINGKLAWTTTIPEVRSGDWSFHQIWVDGQRAQPCRYPKQGYLKVEKALETSSWQTGQDRFQYKSGEVRAWDDLENGEIIIMSRWLESRFAIKQVDETTQTVILDENTPIRIEPGSSTSSGASIFYLENIKDFLDGSGEYHISQRTGQVTYLPLAGQEKILPQVVAPKLGKIIEISGDVKKQEFVEYLLFEGLTFSHGEWFYPKNRLRAVVPKEEIFGYYPGFKVSRNNDANLNIARTHFSGGQASFGVPAFVVAFYTRDCVWENCEFSHVGSYGIDLANSVNNQVVNCQFNDLGAGAIKIGWVREPSYGGHKIVGCHIYDGGLIFHSAVAIWVGKSSGNLVSANHIHHLYYSAVSVGWNWGFLAKPQESGNIIENNHIHHIGISLNNKTPLLNDKGGVYVLGNQPGTIVRGNRIHDIDSYNNFAFGIYLDWGGSNILIENNLVYNTRDGGLMVSSRNRDNLVVNNIFACGRTAQLYLLPSSESIARKIFTFKRNIVLWKEGQLFTENFSHSRDVNLEFDNNIYWKIDDKIDDGKFKLGKYSWKEWQAKGMDRNSKVADPLFISPSERDFRLDPKSPSLPLGFKPIKLLF
jgi:hypothetical protein